MRRFFLRASATPSGHGTWADARRQCSSLPSAPVVNALGWRAFGALQPWEQRSDAVAPSDVYRLELLARRRSSSGSAIAAERWSSPELDSLWVQFVIGGDGNTDSAAAARRDLHRPDADASSSALVAELASLGVAKNVERFVEVTSELQFRIMVSPAGGLGSGADGAETLKCLLSAMNSMPQVPVGLSFGAALVKALSHYAFHMTPEMAAICLGCLGHLDAFYHEDVLTTLVAIAWSDWTGDDGTNHPSSPSETGLDAEGDRSANAALRQNRADSVHILESIAGSLPLIEDLVTPKQLAVYCKRLIAATDADELNLSLALSYLSKLRCNASVLVVGPEVEAMIARRAPSSQGKQLMALTRFCLRFIAYPPCVTSLVSLVERFLRLLTQQAHTEGTLNIAQAFDFMATVNLPQDHSLRVPCGKIFDNAVSQMIEIIRVTSPPQQHTIATVGVGGPCNCAACGTPIGWSASDAPFCLHACNISGVRPLGLEAHLLALQWLVDQGRMPQHCDLALLLLVWLGNRLTEDAAASLTTAGQHAALRRLVAKLSHHGVLTLSGAIRVPDLPTSAADEAAGARSLRDSIHHFLSWQVKHCGGAKTAEAQQHQQGATTVGMQSRLCLVEGQPARFVEVTYRPFAALVRSLRSSAGAARQLAAESRAKVTSPRRMPATTTVDTRRARTVGSATTVPSRRWEVPKELGRTS